MEDEVVIVPTCVVLSDRKIARVGKAALRNELKKQRQQLEARLEELDQLSLSQAEIDNIVTDSTQFLSGLEFIFRQGLPQEKLVALRQCIERIWIDKPAGSIKLAIRLVPAGNLQTTQEFKTSV